MPRIHSETWNVVKIITERIELKTKTVLQNYCEIFEKGLIIQKR